MIKLNNTTVSEGFNGNIPLGIISRLYTSSTDGSTYSLRGTLFRVSREATLTPPSKSATFVSGENITWFLEKSISDRLDKCIQLRNLESLQKDLEDGKYDYGVSRKLIDLIIDLTSSNIKQLPLAVIGGKLAYEDLIKNNEELEGFESKWEQLAHVKMGRKKYTGDALSMESLGTERKVNEDVDVSWVEYPSDNLLQGSTITTIDMRDYAPLLDKGSLEWSTFSEQAVDFSTLLGGLSSRYPAGYSYSRAYIEKVDVLYGEGTFVITSKKNEPTTLYCTPTASLNNRNKGSSVYTEKLIVDIVVNLVNGADKSAVRFKGCTVALIHDLTT